MTKRHDEILQWFIDNARKHDPDAEFPCEEDEIRTILAAWANNQGLVFPLEGRQYGKGPAYRKSIGFAFEADDVVYMVGSGFGDTFSNATFAAFNSLYWKLWGKCLVIHREKK